jgi:hypothetical protein
MTAVAWDAAVAVCRSRRRDGRQRPGCSHRGGADPRRLRALSAQECLQLLGGIGFTWEHDLHLHLKRAMADRQLIGEPDTFRHRGGRRWPGPGRRRALAADLPDEAESASGRAGPGGGRAGRGAGGPNAGGLPWSTPAWSCPTGRSRGAGTPAPSSRWSSTSSWPRWGSSGPTSASGPGPCPSDHRQRHPCSSAPAGCDPPDRRAGTGASCSPSRVPAPTWPASAPGPSRTDGGWLLTGQKVWTSMAQQADWGICPGPDRSGGAQARGDHLLHRGHARQVAWTSGPCGSSPVRPCSTRSSSTRSSSPTTA